MAPIVVQWDNPEQTVIIYHFPQHWTWDDFQNMVTEVDYMIDTVAHTVDLLYDLPDNIVVPSDILLQIRRFVISRHPRSGVLVVVVPNTFIRAFMNTIQRLYSREVMFVRTAPDLASARLILQEVATQRNDNTA